MMKGLWIFFLGLMLSSPLVFGETATAPTANPASGATAAGSNAATAPNVGNGAMQPTAPMAESHPKPTREIARHHRRHHRGRHHHHRHHHRHHRKHRR